MALNIARGPLAEIQNAITAGNILPGTWVVSNDNGNELVLVERDNSKVVIGVGAVKNPTYDAETRTITLPVKQADGTTQDLVINLGKDNVVTSGVYNEETKELELTFVSGEVVKIPASALVDIYTGDATNTVSVSVSNDNKITAQVKLSTKVTNVLKADETGLYVSEGDFVATKQLIVDAQAAAEKHADDELAKEVTARNEAIATAKGEATAYTDTQLAAEVLARDAAIATAKGEATSYTDEKIAAEVTARNEAIATAKSNAEATAKGYTDEKIATEVADRNAAIATAKGEAETTAKNYTDAELAKEVLARDAAIATAKSGAEETAKGYTDAELAKEVTARDAAIATAKGEATGYTDTQIAAEVTARNEAIATAKAGAEETAKGYTDAEIAELKEYVDGVAATAGVINWVDFGA